MPVLTVHKVLKKLILYSPKVQVVEALQPVDRSSRIDSAIDMLRRLEDAAEFFNLLMFSDEDCYHLSGIVNRHMCVCGNLKTPIFTVWYKLALQKLMYDVVVWT